MTPDERRKLSGYYHVMVEQQRVFDDPAVVQARFVTSGPFRVFAQEIVQIEQDFPNLLSPFSDRDFFSHQGSSSGEKLYYVTSIRPYIASCIGRLRARLDAEPEAAPVTQHREFSFVRDASLRKVLERDYGEIQRAHVTNCWKSVIILSGSAIETILTDLLQQNQAQVRSARKAPRENDITKWDLKDLIEVAVELNLVSGGVEKLSHPVRQYRNLVHPGNEIRNKLVFGAEEATIALEVLHILHRDLAV